jgi:hypothetical protein
LLPCVPWSLSLCPQSWRYTAKDCESWNPRDFPGILLALCPCFALLAPIFDVHNSAGDVFVYGIVAVLLSPWKRS